VSDAALDLLVRVELRGLGLDRVVVVFFRACELFCGHRLRLLDLVRLEVLVVAHQLAARVADLV
jgi:hypothetical protein